MCVFEDLQVCGWTRLLIGTAKYSIFGASSWQRSYFNGYIDEAKAYNRPLTQAEITELYTNKYSYDIPDAIANWSFDEGSGSQTIDFIANIVGTLYGPVFSNDIP